MKKFSTVIVALLLVFTLSSCTTEEKEITIIVYSDNPQQTVSDLEDLPELIALELQALGYEFDRVVLQSSDDVSVIESSLENGLVDIAVIDPSMMPSVTTLVRVLDVVKDETDHPDGDFDHTTYQKAIVTAPTILGDAFATVYEISATFTDMNGLSVCSVNDDEDYVEDFAVLLGATSISDVVITHTLSNTTDLYEGLEDGSCDLAVVTLEDFGMYGNQWIENDFGIYESLSVLHTFQPIPYQGFYVNQDAEELLVNSLVQTFIQLSSHSSNQDLLEVLGHHSYRIPD